MDIDQNTLWVLLLAVFSSVATVPVATAAAIRLKLVDKPSSRKRHNGSVPLAGGIVLIIGIWIGFLLLPKTSISWAIALFGLPLFVLGAIDDRFDLSARFRLLIQLMVGAGLVLLFNINIYQLDGIFGIQPIILGSISATVFTLVCACGVLNAINMADGIDGLLGSLSSISLVCISFLAFHAGFSEEGLYALFLVGLLAGYLIYNLGFFGIQRRIFLGDSGSMLIGLSLLVLLVDLSQGENAVITPTSAGWILGVPLLDTVSVMIRRLADCRSPFAAGRDHFHHILQDLGLSRKATLKLLMSLHVCFVLVGCYANFASVSQFVFFWFFVFATLVQYFGISYAVRTIANGDITEKGVRINPLGKF